MQPAEGISAILILGMAGRQGRQTQRGMWSLNMNYRVVTYDRENERMKGHLPVPPFIVSEIKRIAGFQPQDDGLGEYLLDEEQTRQIARIMGFDPEPSRFYYYVEPYDPPEDDGLQENPTH